MLASSEYNLLFWRCIFYRQYQVHPGIPAALCSRHNVINGKIFSRSAILALEVIAFKYILPGKINALVGGVDISVQPDYRWHRESLGHRMQFVTIRWSDQFTLF